VTFFSTVPRRIGDVAVRFGESIAIRVLAIGAFDDDQMVGKRLQALTVKAPATFVKLNVGVVIFFSLRNVTAAPTGWSISQNSFIGCSQVRVSTRPRLGRVMLTGVQCRRKSTGKESVSVTVVRPRCGDGPHRHLRS